MPYSNSNFSRGLLPLVLLSCHCLASAVHPLGRSSSSSSAPAKSVIFTRNTTCHGSKGPWLEVSILSFFNILRSPVGVSPGPKGPLSLYTAPMVWFPSPSSGRYLVTLSALSFSNAYSRAGGRTLFNCLWRVPSRKKVRQSNLRALRKDCAGPLFSVSPALGLPSHIIDEADAHVLL
jgi:hypothetical protein